jgi:hypothetical protein
MDCNLILQSAFNWAKKGRVSSGDFPRYTQVFATVTIHHSIDRPDKRSDEVWYANGPLSRKVKNGQETLVGDIQAWMNRLDFIISDDPKEIRQDLFPQTPEYTLYLRVGITGLITVNKQKDGIFLPGAGFSTFQATCENGLLTGNVDVLGKAVCTVSFSLDYESFPTN